MKRSKQLKKEWKTTPQPPDADPILKSDEAEAYVVQREREILLPQAVCPISSNMVAAMVSEASLTFDQPDDSEKSASPSTVKKMTIALKKTQVPNKFSTLCTRQQAASYSKGQYMGLVCRLRQTWWR